MQNISVIGAGAWGSALAQACALAGRNVTLICREEITANEINQTRKNSQFLGKQILSDNIVATNDYNSLKNADIVLLVVPAQASASVLHSINIECNIEWLSDKPIILCAKGLEQKTMFRQSEILTNIAPKAIPMVLSGPSFAIDVAKGLPTAITLAGKDEALTKSVAKSLAGASFRPYVRYDIIGVELAGSLKNVYALACGAVDGAKLGLSARAALIARSYAEMERLVIKMGGKHATMSGLAGLGDLTLSCTSPQSRNYWFGQQLGMGKTVKEIKASGAKLAEGVLSAPVAQLLARKHNIEMPLIEAVNDLLENKINIKQLVIDLMKRPLKEEGK